MQYLDKDSTKTFILENKKGLDLKMSTSTLRN